VAVSLTGASGKRGPQGASSQRRVHGCASFRSIRIKEKTKKRNRQPRAIFCRQPHSGQNNEWLPLPGKRKRIGKKGFPCLPDLLNQDVYEMTWPVREEYFSSRVQVRLDIISD